MKEQHLKNWINVEVFVGKIDIKPNLIRDREERLTELAYQAAFARP